MPSLTHCNKYLIMSDFRLKNVQKVLLRPMRRHGNERIRIIMRRKPILTKVYRDSELMSGHHLNSVVGVLDAGVPVRGSNEGIVGITRTLTNNKAGPLSMIVHSIDNLLSRFLQNLYQN